MTRDVSERIGKIIKRGLERGRITVEEEIINEQPEETVREKLRLFNTFVMNVRELGEKPPKSVLRDENKKYRQNLDDLVWTWKNQICSLLPYFTEDELNRIIGREIKGKLARERCLEIAIVFAKYDEPLTFGELLKKARWLRSFADLRGSSMNKTLDRTLKNLKRAGLIVQAGYYFRMFNLNKSEARSSDIVTIKRFERLEDVLVRLQRDLSHIKECLTSIIEILSKTRRFSGW